MSQSPLELTDAARDRHQMLENYYPKLLTSTWGAQFVYSGADAVKQEISGYYANLGIISALLAGFTMSASLSAGEVEQDGPLDQAIGATFAICFSGFLVCIMDCIFIDNAVKQAPGALIMHVIDTNQVVLVVPKIGIAVGLLLMIFNVVLRCWKQFGDAVFWTSFGLNVIVFAGLVRRYLIMRTTVYRAAATAMDIQKVPNFKGYATAMIATDVLAGNGLVKKSISSSSKVDVHPLHA